ncbi:unnamed protein product [Nezara viridula]|uniref:Neuropeptide n=1 Tax=Nezara viridula TaxID=85310 RepID=A0A9P0MVW0_NEZVI|nr:unnamed protein product [Nezara viridula]
MLFFKAVLACGFVAVVPTVSSQAVPSTSTSPIWNSFPSGSGKNIQDSFNYPAKWVSSAGSNKIIKDAVQRFTDTGEQIANTVIRVGTLPLKVGLDVLKNGISIGNNNYETIPGKKWVETTTKPWADNTHKTEGTGTNKGSEYANGGWDQSNSGNTGINWSSSPDLTGTGWTNGQQKETDVAGNTVVAILPPATSTSGKTSISGEAASIDESKQKSD